MTRFVPLLALVWSLMACDDNANLPQMPTAEGIFAPMGSILPRATEEEQRLFAQGLVVANKRWTKEEGLGPEFNVTFCAACHEKPGFGGAAGRYRDFLLVGRQGPDGEFVGAGVNGVQPQFTLESRSPSENVLPLVATRSPIPFFGAGLLLEVPDEYLLSLADPDDEDGDGISGRHNLDNGAVGRFGRKAQARHIEAFVRGPLNNHLGLTSLPSEETPGSSSTQSAALERIGATSEHAQISAGDDATHDADDVPDPEVSRIELAQLVAFASLLAAPIPDEPNEQSIRGFDYFKDIGCGNCHRPSLETPRGSIPVFSDLLVHDMGDEMADGIKMGLAEGNEFRTQPLWGVVGASPYLHDGRADTLGEAIFWHGGEALNARSRYDALPSSAREDVIYFLESLGGRSQSSSGMLPQKSLAPQAFEYGGPNDTLGSEESARFERGRRLFDREFERKEGLGPLFNGDSCRACHFEPVLGGAGPQGVDVIRQSVRTTVASVQAPPDGNTALPRFSILGNRPEPHPNSDVFEHRQTPSILGLGLVEDIEDSEIVSRADPLDEDGNGVSGRVRILSDGRVGRLGWKASAPSLLDFARDAMSNEIGLTVPESTQSNFGLSHDDDEFEGIEISNTELEDLVFFMKTLAPPPRSSVDAVLESTGESLFTNVGCDRCHSPTLRAEDGSEIRLYSDLLLHDVAPSFFVGIADGDVSHREFRTPPLWGVSNSAPYMHDGLASTLQQAIQNHHAEAENIRLSYEALEPVERFALLAFLRSL